MDNKLEKAFQTANLMATLANQRRSAFEEFEQNLIYYTNGSSFLITKELIAFVKSMVDLNYTKNVVVIDDNGIPVSIEDLNLFLTNIIDQYYRVANEYFAVYSNIRSKRKIEDLIKL
jgi:hypothetical protein